MRRNATKSHPAFLYGKGGPSSSSLASLPLFWAIPYERAPKSCMYTIMERAHVNLQIGRHYYSPNFHPWDTKVLAQLGKVPSLYWISPHVVRAVDILKTINDDIFPLRTPFCERVSEYQTLLRYSTELTKSTLVV